MHVFLSSLVGLYNFRKEIEATPLGTRCMWAASAISENRWSANHPRR